MFGRKTTLALLTGGLVLAGSGAAVWAATPTPQVYGDEIHACVGDHGKLRLAFHGCRRSEDHISWNRQGPTGPVGPPGPSLNPTVAAAVETSGLPNNGVFTPAANNVWQAVPGLTLALPATGTYLLSANARAIIADAANSAHNCYVSTRLVTGAPAAVLANSERTVITAINNLPPYTDNVQATAPTQMIFTGNAGTIVALQALRVGAGCPAVTGIAQNGDGASTLNAVRIN